MLTAKGKLFIRQIATGTPEAAAKTIFDSNILGDEARVVGLQAHGRVLRHNARPRPS